MLANLSPSKLGNAFESSLYLSPNATFKKKNKKGESKKQTNL